MGKKKKSAPRPRLSFVIPTYNRSHMLADAVQSCIHQSEKRIEIVVVDDGSTDSTPKLMDWFVKQDPRVRYHRRRKNLGISATRNEGAGLATAPIICVLDSDDMCLEHRGRITLAHFQKNRKSQLFWGRATLVDFFGNRVGSLPEPRPLDIDDLSTGGNTWVVHSTVAYTREFARRHPYEPGEWSKYGADDYRMLCGAALAKEPMDFTPDHLCAYREMGNDGISYDRDHEALDRVKQKFWEGVLAERS